MGTNNPNLPNSVLSEASAMQYIAALVNAMRLNLYTALTGSPTVTAAQMVGGAVAVSGGVTANLTTDTAVAIIARMKAIDPNAGNGSTFVFTVINDNSGILTVVAGTGVTLGTGSGSSVAAGGAYKLIGTQLTATTISLIRG